MDNSKLLICPGAQKAGTTWLYRVLKEHPDFWLPPQKEIDYLALFPASREKYAKKLGERLASDAIKPANRAWVARFLKEWRLERYPRLFREGGEKFCADVSPNYSTMSRQEVSHASRVAFGASIVIIFRDPAERAWSQAQQVSQNWDQEPQGLAERLGRFAVSRACAVRSDYPRMLVDWRAFFGDDKVLAVYYDDLKRDPKFFINRILSFMGAPPYPMDKENGLFQTHNVGGGVAMPEEIRSRLTAHYAPVVAGLRELLPEADRPAWLGSEERASQGFL